MAGPKPSSFLGDCLLFLTGATSAVLLFWAFYTFASSSSPSAVFSTLSSAAVRHIPFSSSSSSSSSSSVGDGSHRDPPTSTFYDDPSLGYTVDSPLKGWDEKRRHWLDLHPSLRGGSGSTPRVLLLSGSQSTPCKNPVGDHLLLRLLKNKVDYSRIHGHDLFYNNALFHPRMPEYWSKIPTIRAAMVAHPETEWIWWVDADAAFTDMDFALPLHKYSSHNLVVHGWPNVVYGNKSWTGLNAGVFLIRNCQWSLDFMEAWAKMGPQTPEYGQWGKAQKALIKDKLYPEADDQSGLVYLLLKEKEKWGEKVYLESEYYFEGYWVEIVGRLENITARYLQMERKVPVLRRRRAEKVAEPYGERREAEMEREGVRSAVGGWRRPFITHFTGCQPCTGRHNEIYGGEECWEGVRRALDFADDQVLRAYGFRHERLGGKGAAEVRPVPFDYPAAR